VRKFLLLFFSIATINLYAQTPQQLLKEVSDQFKKVQTYQSEVDILFDIPSVTIDPIKGKAFYKAPSKFRIRTTGVAFLPKQDPYQVVRLLDDPSAYLAVFNGDEKVQGKNCRIINIIPSKEGDLVMAKVWLNAPMKSILKMQVTTKSSGVVLVENVFGRFQSYGLPDRSVFTIDMSTFKVPKGVSIDINTSSSPESKEKRRTSGKIHLHFKDYVINQKVDDKIFQETTN
jgi:hypothetical protein